MSEDPYRYFRVEARQILDELESGILQLERGDGVRDVVARLLRHAHTLKGAARVVKQREIADLAHAIEDSLAPMREGAAPSRERIDELLALRDGIATRVSALTPPAEGRDAPAPPRAAASDGDATLAAGEAAEVDDLLEGLLELGAHITSARRADASLEELTRLAASLADRLAAPAPHADSAAEARAIARDLCALAARAERQSSTAHERAERQLREARESAERLRLRAGSTIFAALERTARDAAVSLRKRVAFRAVGGEVRLEARVLGVVQAALVQAVRNAVAHGIEPERERTAAGKPAEGTVVVEIARRGTQVSFACRDDGRGVDIEAVRVAAERRGLAPADSGRWGDDELLRTLLHGGISTSATVSTVAGRGVGMDVVRAAAERLGGTVDLRTAPGQGTTLELRAPVSLAAFDALIVESRGRAVAVPTDATRLAVRLAAAEVVRTAGREAIVVGGDLVPSIPLARVLRGASSDSPLAGAAAVVVDGRGATAALTFERAVGVERVVMRPLPAGTPADPVVAGVCLGVDGSTRLLLDADELVALARSGARPSPAEPAAPPAPPRLPILVVDDSLTSRMLEQSTLESAGYEVDVASSGEEGFEKAHARRYALFLVDVEMPGMDGFEFVARASADPALRHIPAILVTSRGSTEDRRRGEAAGARAHIVKSEFDHRVLLDLIRSLLA